MGDILALVAGPTPINLSFTDSPSRAQTEECRSPYPTTLNGEAATLSNIELISFVEESSVDNSHFYFI